MSLRAVGLAAIVFACLISSVSPARAEEVSVRLSPDGGLEVKTPVYHARLGSDGNLHSLRIGDTEMIDDRVSFSLGAFFSSDGPRRLATVTLPAPAKVHATDGTFAAEYLFLASEIRLTLSQSGAKKAPFYIVLSKEVSTATDPRTGTVAATPTEQPWPDVTFTARSGSYITLRGGDRIWGPWAERQMWELGPIEAGTLREVSITPGVGQPPKPTPSELITLAVSAGDGDRVLRSGQPAEVSVAVDNRGDALTDALLTVSLNTPRGGPATEVAQSLSVGANSRVPAKFNISLLDPGVYTARATLSVGGKPLKDTATVLAFRPEEIRSVASLPVDYSDFWKMAGAEAKLSPGESLPELTEDQTQSTQEVRVWKVIFSGVKGEHLFGWLCIPNRPGRHPAVLQLPGYGRPKIDPPMMLASRGYVALAADLVAEGADTAYFAHELDDPRAYPYRQIVVNALRAFDLLLARPEVDAQRVAVAGAGQGGGLAVIVASLRPSVAALMADSPLLCDFPYSIVSGGWPYSEIAQYLRAHGEDAARVASTLSYFDVLNAAPRVRRPALFSLGLKDATCLPETIFAAYNALAGPRDIRVYPDAGHEAGGGSEHWTYKLQWLDGILRPSSGEPGGDSGGSDQPASPGA